MPEQQLSFYIPKHGRERVTLRIPESHSLYICPPACGRRHGIRAIKNGEKDHVSFLYVTPNDLSGGAYEQEIGDAVFELLALLAHKPRVFELYFNCVDDFLGTDEKPLLASLESRFPDVRFVALRHNPVAFHEKIKPGERAHAQLFSLLSPAEKDDGINFIGNFVPLHPDNELFAILSEWSIAPVRQIFACKSYDEYMRLANSRLNLVLHEMGTYAAQQMKERLGMDWLFLPPSYRPAQIKEQYAALAHALGKPVPDLDGYEAQLMQEAEETKKALAGREIVVDSGASMRPCGLARALLELGFSVHAIFLIHPKDSDEEDRQWLEKNCPDLMLLSQEDCGRLSERALPDNPICIGFDSAYLLKSARFVDAYHDEGLFGYYGLRSVLFGLREMG